MFEKDNMKKLVIYLVATVAIAYGIGVSAFISYNSGRAADTNGRRGSLTSNVKQEKVVSLDSVNTVNVEVSSTDVNIIPEKRSDIKAELAGSVTSTSRYTEPVLEASKDGDTINIRIKTHNQVFIGFFSSSVKLNVYVPSDFSKELKLTSSSGDINVQELSPNSLSCKLSSGDLKLGKITANSFSHSASSGSLTADQLLTKDSNINSSSGRMRINNFSGNLKGSSSSGDIYVNYKEFNHNVDLQASSGRIELTLPEDSEFKLYARASSGRVTCRFPITISGEKKNNYLEGTVKSSKNSINLRTSSGNISVLN